MTQLHARHELMYGDVKLFAGTACPELAQQIADHLGTGTLRTRHHRIPK